MATVYNVKIKMVSPWVIYNEKYITDMFENFLKQYRDIDTDQGFEGVEIEVEKR